MIDNCLKDRTSFVEQLLCWMWFICDSTDYEKIYLILLKKTTWKKTWEEKHENRKLKIVPRSFSPRVVDDTNTHFISIYNTIQKQAIVEIHVKPYSCCLSTANKSTKSLNRIKIHTSCTSYTFGLYACMFVFYLFDQVTFGTNASSSSLFRCNRELRNAEQGDREKFKMDIPHATLCSFK